MLYIIQLARGFTVEAKNQLTVLMRIPVYTDITDNSHLQQALTQTT